MVEEDFAAKSENVLPGNKSNPLSLICGSVVLTAITESMFLLTMETLIRSPLACNSTVLLGDVFKNCGRPFTQNKNVHF